MASPPRLPVVARSRLCGLGEIALAKSDFQEAEDYLKRSAAIREKFDPNMLGTSLRGLGNFYAGQERFEEAERIEKLLRTPAVQRDLDGDKDE